MHNILVGAMTEIPRSGIGACPISFSLNALFQPDSRHGPRRRAGLAVITVSSDATDQIAAGALLVPAWAAVSMQRKAPVKIQLAESVSTDVVDWQPIKQARGWARTPKLGHQAFLVHTRLPAPSPARIKQAKDPLTPCGQHLP